MKGKLLYYLLESLKDGIVDYSLFIDAVLDAGYGASMNRIDYTYRKKSEDYLNRKIRKTSQKKLRIKLQKFVSKLKHEGLLFVKEKKGVKKITISRDGKSKLAALRKKLPFQGYDSAISVSPIIVSFDIPERKRKERDWFRRILINLDFIMIHKSVWVGKIKIPQQLLMDLADLKILDYIEIFEVGKSGTLRKIGKS